MGAPLGPDGNIHFSFHQSGSLWSTGQMKLYSRTNSTMINARTRTSTHVVVLERSVSSRLLLIIDERERVVRRNGNAHQRGMLKIPYHLNFIDCRMPWLPPWRECAAGLRGS